MAEKKWSDDFGAADVSHETQDSIAAQLAYGEQCADTDGLALLAASDDAVTISRREYRELQNKATALAEVRAEYDIAKRCLEAKHAREVQMMADCLSNATSAWEAAEKRIHDLEAQAVRLTIERNDALQDAFNKAVELAQTSARHGVQREAATGASGPCETPRANPFAGGWATSWSLR